MSTEIFYMHFNFTGSTLSLKSACCSSLLIGRKVVNSYN